jgi:hypothetical protein
VYHHNQPDQSSFLTLSTIPPHYLHRSYAKPE